MNAYLGTVLIGRRRIGPDAPCFIIAEAGVNHNGNLRRAKKMIDAAKAFGADAVKFQSFKADKLATAGAPKAAYQKRTTRRRESQLDMLRRLELHPEMQRALMVYCRKKNILFMSTPFEEESADFLDAMGVRVFKTPSGEITNLPFLEHIARKGKPMIVSTGMATLSEVSKAVKSIRQAGNEKLALLHCVSNYPANPKDINLRAMDTLTASFGVPVGFSDHTLGIEIALGAVARGACIIEKHFTLDRTLAGPDHQASLEPREFATLVKGIRTIEEAMGHGRKEPAASEKPIAAVARKSLVSNCRLPHGTLIRQSMLALRRPGTGLDWGQRAKILGHRTKVEIPAGTLISTKMIL